MSEIKTGGPAFPIHWQTHEEGMTLRDYFAAKALPQLLFGRASYEFDDCAREAYKVADEMIKAREEK